MRGATYKADVDKVLVVRRPTPQVAELRKLDPATGAELVDSPTPLLDQGDVASTDDAVAPERRFHYNHRAEDAHLGRHEHGPGQYRCTHH